MYILQHRVHSATRSTFCNTEYILQHRVHHVPQVWNKELCGEGLLRSAFVEAAFTPFPWALPLPPLSFQVSVLIVVLSYVNVARNILSYTRQTYHATFPSIHRQSYHPIKTLASSCTLKERKAASRARVAEWRARDTPFCPSLPNSSSKGRTAP